MDEHLDKYRQLEEAYENLAQAFIKFSLAFNKVKHHKPIEKD